MREPLNRMCFPCESWGPNLPQPSLRLRFVLPSEGLDLYEVEKQLIRQALARTGGNQTRAAKLLSISRDSLRYKLKKYDLRPSTRPVATMS